MPVGPLPAGCRKGMQVEVTPAEDNTARLSVTVSPEEVNSAIDSTYQKLAQRVKIPGFRPGKAPRPILLRTIGEETFYHEVTDDVIRKWYPKAVEESGIEAIDQGQLDSDGHDHVHSGEAFSFVATIPVKPEVNLPDYGEIKIPAPPIIATDGDVDDVIDNVRKARATLESAPAKAADIGDVVKMNIKGRSDGNEVLSQEEFNFEIVDENETPDQQFPGLSKELVGSRPGDIREIILQLPADYQEEELAGHSLALTVVVKGIQRKILPDVTDEFAKEISSAETVSDLRDMVRQNLIKERTDEATSKVANEVIDSLIARSNLQVPDVMVSEEQDRLLRDHRRYFERRDMRFDQFLMATRKSEDEYRDELRPAAERQVKRDLLLDAVANAENIEADRDIVDAQVRRMSEAVSRSARDVKRLSASTALHKSIAEDIARRQALARLVEITSGLKVEQDEDLPGENDEATPEMAEHAAEVDAVESATV
jgi:trigger factor